MKSIFVIKHANLAKGDRWRLALELVLVLPCDSPLLAHCLPEVVYAKLSYNSYTWSCYFFLKAHNISRPSLYSLARVLARFQRLC